MAQNVTSRAGKARKAPARKAAPDACRVCGEGGVDPCDACGKIVCGYHNSWVDGALLCNDCRDAALDA